MLDSKGFDLWADGYDESVRISEASDRYPFAGYKKVLGTIYERIRQQDGRKILDIGFGTGVLSKKLYDDGYDLWGIDFSSEMIHIARKKMPKARLIQYDFTKGLPEALNNETFDGIICTYAIHHLNDSEKIAFIRQLSDHLTDQGQIYIGDVAFEREIDLKQCQEESRDLWDADEIYPVKENLLPAFPDLEFIKITDCSGIFIF